MSLYKVNLTFPHELMDEIDDYAKTHYLTRSGFVQLACTEYLTAHRMTAAMEKMLELIQDWAKRSDTLTEEDQKQIEDLENILSIINNRPGK